MDNTVAIIDVRELGSPVVGASRRLGGKALLEWVIRRVAESTRLDAIAVAVDSATRLESLAQFVPAKVHVTCEDDPIKQYIAIADHYAARAIVRVSAANPFVDAALIDRLIATADEHPDCEFICYRSRQSSPAMLSALGAFGEWMTVDALRTADQESRGAVRPQRVGQYIQNRPDRFITRWLALPQPLDRGDLRLTIEHPEDWDHAEEIFEALGHDRLDWQQITGFLRHQPRLRARMAHLNRLCVTS